MAKTKSPRELAYEALLAVERDGMQSHLVIQETLQKLPDSTRDRAFFMRLAEGTIEYRIQLDHVIDQFSRTKTTKMRPGIREILRMAVYQILYMDSVPDRAAVNEAVSLAMHKGFSGLRGFVNGVLRTIAREKESLQWPDRKKDPVHALSVRYSVSEEILAAWIPRYGEDKAEEICRAFLEERPLTGHWFEKPAAPAGDGSGKTAPAPEDPPGKTAPVAKDRPVRPVLQHDSGYLTPTGILDNSFFISRGTDPSEIPAFREGNLYIQDLSSQIAVTAADIHPQDRVLDLCAAPGGKSLLAAECGAWVLSRDLTEEKTALIRENAARLGLLEAYGAAGEAENADELCGQEENGPAGRMRRTGLRVETADAVVFDPALEGAFDVVIADLPCSGFGVCGRKPEIKYKPYRETVAALAELQRQILANAVRYVRPGGKLLYSTCTIAEEENEGNVRWLLKKYGSTHRLHPAEISKPVRELLAARSVPAGEYGVQLLPSDGPWDGFFFVLLEIKNDR